MLKIFKFYKEKTNNWFADVPKWKGDKEDLQMVLGADTMLNYIANGKNEITLEISTEPIEQSFKLTLVKRGTIEGGGYYCVTAPNGQVIVSFAWLCGVLEFVFDNIPEKLYIILKNNL